MEYLPGGELFDYVLERDGLSETAAQDMFVELALAVQHCHKVNIPKCHVMSNTPTGLDV